MSDSRRLSRGLIVGGSASALALLSGVTNVHAAESDTIAEIIVTAQKRSEALIDVPLSISVVGGDLLERQQATNFQDYLKLVPGVQLNQSTPGNGRLVMRGVNTGSVAATVAVYVDETPFGSSTGLVNGGVLAGDFDAFDMQRIEVLRGPQGTLYGANSLAGVLKFATNAPQTDGFETRVRFGAESVEDGDMGYSGAGMINVPLSGSFAIRATGYYRELPGFIDSIGTAGSDIAKDINDAESSGGRVSALYRPSDAFSLRLTAIMQNIRTDASSTVESDPDTLETLYSRFTQSQFVPEYRDVDYRIYNALLDVDLGFATLTSSSSFNKLDSPFREDLTTLYSSLIEGFVGPNEFQQLQTTKYDKFTQELRLASPTGDTFDWLAGAYYTSEEGDILQHLEALVPGTMTPIAGQPQLGDLSLHSEYEEIAVFASGTIHFGDRFDLTLGARYSENDQTAKQDSIGLLAGGPSGVSYPEARSTEEVFTYSVSPKFKISDNVSLYARVASGFRPGGPNVLPPGVPDVVPLSYESDSLTSYEVGFKSESASRAYSVDVSVFHIDWEDIQLFTQVDIFGVNVNGGGATSDGLEATVTARPTDSLRLSLNAAYTDAELDDDTGDLVGGMKGDQLPFTPEFSVGANVDYEWAIGADSTAYVGASLRYLSDQTASFDADFRELNGRQREIPSYEVLDLRTGVLLGRYSIELYAKNVTDSDGLTSTGTLGTYPNGAIGAGVIRPRTVGLSFGFGM
ncbi:MAG TPA: TonB-dependent receptor [Steroidobacter sp.]|uniref:TonB-dependent receptor n=1 Tax=Steroidobacter sp. TaxID=1978227 RepID=UPI002EDB95B0